MPIAFPGAMFNAEGISLDATMPDLTQDMLDHHPHRSMVTKEDVAPVARVWLLADDATPTAILQPILDEAVQFVLAGKGVLILAKRPGTRSGRARGAVARPGPIHGTQGRGRARMRVQPAIAPSQATLQASVAVPC